MLVELTVHNFAVIEEARLSLAPGFNVITGETGAGKSLLVDALDMVLGGRVDRDIIRSGAEHAWVEAVFQITRTESAHVEKLPEEEVNVGDDGVLVFARELHREGRSIYRLNGRAVPLGLIRMASRRLLDIHGQGDHLALLESAFQLQLLDSFGGLNELRTIVTGLVSKVHQAETEITRLSGDDSGVVRKRGYLEEEIEEIEAAQISLGEEEVLQSERTLLIQVQTIKQACNEIHRILYRGSPSASELVITAKKSLEKTPDPKGNLEQQIKVLEVAHAQIEDVAGEVRSFSDSLEDDPRRLEDLEERLELLRRLQRKYGGSLEQILSYAEGLRGDLQVAQGNDDRIAELKKILDQSRKEAGSKAWELSVKRQQAVIALDQAVTAELVDLKLEGVRFAAYLSQEENVGGLDSPDGVQYNFTESGIDRLEFRVSTNPGEDLKALEKVASGGETSRLMLAIKGAFQIKDPVATLVFDEIDNGVGGRTGEVVGRKLWELGHGGARAQVVCVTHLPQIAAYADHHLRVDKQVLLGRTFAHVVSMELPHRVSEISSMLGGQDGPEIERVARQMLNRATLFKSETVGNLGGV